MTRIYEVVDRYIGMWEWIRDNLKKLRKEECGIIGAKGQYRNAQGDKMALGNCIMCVAYAGCDDCPLGVCYSVGSYYDIVADYLLDHGHIKRKEARRACDAIIRAHEDLKRNPTDLLRRSI